MLNEFVVFKHLINIIDKHNNVYCIQYSLDLLGFVSIWTYLKRFCISELACQYVYIALYNTYEY